MYYFCQSSYKCLYQCSFYKKTLNYQNLLKICWGNNALKLSWHDAENRKISTAALHQGVNVRPQMITSRLMADRLIRDLNEVEIERLSKALEDFHEETMLENKVLPVAPSLRVLFLMAFANSIPFIGFGFLDNAIMIAAGEYIDLTLGAALGISTMAAAALGNMISDVAGIGLAGYVEALAVRLGLEEPRLTSEQLTMRKTRIACHTGRAIGIVIGCIFGMFPLLLITSKKEAGENELTQNVEDLGVL